MCKVGVCVKDMVMENPRPYRYRYRAGNTLVHGLTRCKNGCGYWNRDVNGATNIYRIAYNYYNAINIEERPNYLSRRSNEPEPEPESEPEKPPEPVRVRFRKRSRSRASDQATHEEAITPQGF